MNGTWQADEPEKNGAVSFLGWVRVLVKGSAIAVVVFGGLAILLVLRLIERPLNGVHRPLTPYVTQAVCRISLWIIGLCVSVYGHPMKHRGALVANHSSWLDIFVLNAQKNIYFVSKSEVAGWPGIGWLARATGTVFIRRNAREAKAQTRLFERRLLANHKLLFFPEGTSTDGLRVLRFKSTLFAAFFSQNLKDEMWIQPVSLVYHAPSGRSPRFYGWWGDMDFGSHLVKTLGSRRQGRVYLIYHPPLHLQDFEGRKMLALKAEELVREGHQKLCEINQIETEADFAD